MPDCNGAWDEEFKTDIRSWINKLQSDSLWTSAAWHGKGGTGNVDGGMVRSWWSHMTIGCGPNTTTQLNNITDLPTSTQDHLTIIIASIANHEDLLFWHEFLISVPSESNPGYLAWTSSCTRWPVETATMPICGGCGAVLVTEGGFQHHLAMTKNHYVKNILINNSCISIMIEKKVSCSHTFTLVYMQKASSIETLH